METIDDFFFKPRVVSGKYLAERLYDGVVVELRDKAVCTTPLVYKGRSIYADRKRCENGSISLDDIYRAIKHREEHFGDGDGRGL